MRNTITKTYNTGNGIQITNSIEGAKLSGISYTIAKEAVPLFQSATLILSGNLNISIAGTLFIEDEDSHSKLVDKKFDIELYGLSEYGSPLTSKLIGVALCCVNNCPHMPTEQHAFVADRFIPWHQP